MSFFTTSDATPLATDGTFDANPPMEVIPKNTCVTAVPTEIEIENNDGQYAEPANGHQYAKIRWDVIDGEFKSRVIFQKLYLWATDTKKRDKAMRMTAAIDANAGGQLMAAGVEPTQMAMLQAWSNKPQILQVDVWDKEENGKKVPGGNWVRAVYNKASKPAASAHSASTPPAASAPAFDPNQDIDF